MINKSRRFVAIPVAIAAVIVVAAGAVAGGFATGLIPGNSTNGASTVMAGFMDAQGDSIDIQAMSGRMTFLPRGGGPAIVEDTTTVFVDAFTPTGLFGTACWTVPTPPFTIRANDNSATLAFDSSAPGVQPCPGQLVSSGLPIQQSLTPASSNDGIDGPVTVTVQWTPLGVATTMHSNSTITCLSWRGVIHGTQLWQDSHANAQVGSFTVDGFDQNGNPVQQSFAGPYSSDAGVVTTFGSSQVVSGPSSGSCGPFGN